MKYCGFKLAKLNLLSLNKEHVYESLYQKPISFLVRTLPSTQHGFVCKCMKSFFLPRALKQFSI